MARFYRHQPWQEALPRLRGEWSLSASKEAAELDVVGPTKGGGGRSRCAYPLADAFVQSTLISSRINYVFMSIRTMFLCWFDWQIWSESKV